MLQVYFAANAFLPPQLGCPELAPGQWLGRPLAGLSVNTHVVG